MRGDQYRVRLREDMKDGHNTVVRVIKANDPFKALEKFLEAKDRVVLRGDVELVSVERV